MTNMDVIQWARDASERKLGEFGEAIWGNIFRSSGVNYIPLSQIQNGGAPRVENNRGGVVLPDFDCATENWTAFVDSKCKRQAVRFRQKNQVRHGIDRRNYEAYERSAEIYRKSAAIAVVELFDDDGKTWTGRLLLQTLRGLGEPAGGFSNQSHMVYWPRKMFADIDSLSPEELMATAQGRRRESYAAILRQVFDRKTQVEMFA